MWYRGEEKEIFVLSIVEEMIGKKNVPASTRDYVRSRVYEILNKKLVGEKNLVFDQKLREYIKANA